MQRATSLVILSAALVLGASSAGASNLELRLGGFFPRAQSTLFDDVSELFTVDKSDWRGVTGGAEFNVVVFPNVEVGLSVDGYARSLESHYRDFVRESGAEIHQSLTWNVVPVGLSVRLIPTAGRQRLAPYVAVGADLFFWRYEEHGDFVDFGDPDLEIFADTFVAEGVEPGFHVAAGLRVPLSYDFSVSVELRYQQAKARMGDDFAPNEPGLVNELDLTGTSLTAGFNIRF